jgi:RNA polymerase sigma factor (sigma-70 family)
METKALDQRGQQIAECMRQARPRLQALFRSHRCSHEDAEDILQEALLVLVRRWDEIEEPQYFVVGVVRRQILSLLRRRRSHREVSVDEASLEQIDGGEDPQALADSRHDLCALLSVLPARGGQIVEMRYGEGLSSREIAAELSYAVSSVRKIAARHLHRLRRYADKIGFHR